MIQIIIYLLFFLLVVTASAHAQQFVIIKFKILDYNNISMLSAFVLFEPIKKVISNDFNVHYCITGIPEATNGFLVIHIGYNPDKK